MRWCPVLSEAPLPGLPWPERQERLASARAVRPLEDLWLASSVMGILAGDCRWVQGLRSWVL